MFTFFKRLASSVSTPSTGKVRFFIDENGLPKAKLDTGSLVDFVGPQGNPGIQGIPGISAYQVAVNNGFVGTQSAWLASLIGPQGISAYQVALNNGFVGSISTWLASLVGPQGLSAYQVALNGGFVGTQSAWLASLIGPQGIDAYQVALNNGFVGSQSAWLLSLVGPQGNSAYQVAVNNGFVGSESVWLASLVGPTGPQGPALQFARLTSILSTTSNSPQTIPALQLTVPPGKFAQVVGLLVVQSSGGTTGVGVGLTVQNPVGGSTSDVTWAIDNPVAATNTNNTLYDGDFVQITANSTSTATTSLATASSSNANQVVRVEAHIYNPSVTQSLIVNAHFYSENSGVSVSVRPGSAISMMLS